MTTEVIRITARRESPAECDGCGHSIHAVYGCRSAALFTREARCGCDSSYGSPPRKWGGDAA